ncbi:hypothetical protein CXG81DRAFT_19682 [Caulochytrium protostelioides]|uniref:IFT122 second beta-propeller domain-containing protein n=1 Tax=Caulochytrium protostelioides TaxID=1555241 RepID=A0A4V1IUF2_9FUNG|nr:hypothetical protein CXG81DRAFT_19682 [Caulochytrium protostelioides]|eukprot:RKP00349.1 hypothetical protein CXG81DRAFT_19682 [Caulochytrium protostelioides]
MLRDVAPPPARKKGDRPLLPFPSLRPQRIYSTPRQRMGDRPSDRFLAVFPSCAEPPSYDDARCLCRWSEEPRVYFGGLEAGLSRLSSPRGAGRICMRREGHQIRACHLSLVACPCDLATPHPHTADCLLLAASAASAVSTSGSDGHDCARLPGMEATLCWSESLVTPDGQPVPIYDAAFHPNGLQIALTAGTQILVYGYGKGDEAPPDGGGVDGSTDGDAVHAAEADENALENAACGPRLRPLSATLRAPDPPQDTWRLVHTLAAHRGAVTCVDWSPDGERIVSGGGVDEHVILWNAESGRPTAKYGHGFGVQRVLCNPHSPHILSTGNAGWGLWCPASSTAAAASRGDGDGGDGSGDDGGDAAGSGGKLSSRKAPAASSFASAAANARFHKVVSRSRVVAAAWARDGRQFALGCEDGTLQVCSRAGNVLHKMARDAGIWALAWMPDPTAPPPQHHVATSGGGNTLAAARAHVREVLAVTDFKSQLAILTDDLQSLRKQDRALPFDALALGVLPDLDLLYVAGSNRAVAFYSFEGTPVLSTCEADGWVWSCVARPPTAQSGRQLLTGTQTGRVSLWQLETRRVQTVAYDRIAYVENLTDIILQHLVTQQKARIRCRDIVQTMAIHEDRLAVQLTDRFILYQLLSDKPADAMNYHMKCKLTLAPDLALAMGAATRRLNADAAAAATPPPAGLAGLAAPPCKYVDILPQGLWVAHAPSAPPGLRQDQMPATAFALYDVARGAVLKQVALDRDDPPTACALVGGIAFMATAAGRIVRLRHDRAQPIDVARVPRTYAMGTIRQIAPSPFLDRVALVDTDGRVLVMAIATGAVIFTTADAVPAAGVADPTTDVDVDVDAGAGWQLLEAALKRHAPVDTVCWNRYQNETFVLASTAEAEVYIGDRCVARVPLVHSATTRVDVVGLVGSSLLVHDGVSLIHHQVAYTRYWRDGLMGPPPRSDGRADGDARHGLRAPPVSFNRILQLVRFAPTATELIWLAERALEWGRPDVALACYHDLAALGVRSRELEADYLHEIVKAAPPPPVVARIEPADAAVATTATRAAGAGGDASTPAAAWAASGAAWDHMHDAVAPQPLTKPQMATLLAMRGDYPAAASLFVACGQLTLALDMYTLLAMWGEAERLADSQHVSAAPWLTRQADSLQAAHQFVGAADALWRLGEYGRAMAILTAQGLVDAVEAKCLGLAQASSSSSSSSPTAFAPASEPAATAAPVVSAAQRRQRRAALFQGITFLRSAQPDVALRVLDAFRFTPRVSDTPGDDRLVVATTNNGDEADDESGRVLLLQTRLEILVELGRWREAFTVLRDDVRGDAAFSGQPLPPAMQRLQRQVYLAYADHLLANGACLEAQAYYRAAGAAARARRVLCTLLSAAIQENRFTDAAFMHTLLAQSRRSSEAEDPAPDAAWEAMPAMTPAWHRTAASWLFTYTQIYEHVVDGRRDRAAPSAIFTAAAVLLNALDRAAAGHVPSAAVQGIRVSVCAHAVARLGLAMGDVRSAKAAVARLARLKPLREMGARGGRAAIQTLQLQVAAVDDGATDAAAAGAGARDTCPLCYHVFPSGHSEAACPACGLELVRSAVSLALLPLARFTVARPASASRSPRRRRDDGDDGDGASAANATDSDVEDAYAITRLMAAADADELDPAVKQRWGLAADARATPPAVPVAWTLQDGAVVLTPDQLLALPAPCLRTVPGDGTTPTRYYVVGDPKPILVAAHAAALAAQRQQRQTHGGMATAAAVPDSVPAASRHFWRGDDVRTCGSCGAMCLDEEWVYYTLLSGGACPLCRQNAYAMPPSVAPPPSAKRGSGPRDATAQRPLLREDPAAATTCGPVGGSRWTAEPGADTAETGVAETGVAAEAEAEAGPMISITMGCASVADVGTDPTGGTPAAGEASTDAPAAVVVAVPGSAGLGPATAFNGDAAAGRWRAAPSTSIAAVGLARTPAAAVPGGGG